MHERLSSRRGSLLRGLLLLAGLSLLAGCKVTAEDIEYWQGTVKGPGKIVAVMLAERYPIELRTQAALALVEMERNDRDYVQSLQQAIQTLQSQDPEATQQIVDGMVAGLQEMMRGGNETQQDPALGPPLSQVRAKDAAYILIPHASPATRQQLVAAVVGWYAVDFAERNLAGNYSAEQVVRSLGAPAAEQLVDAMSAEQPQQALIKIAELIGQIGSPATKGRAAQRMVDIERQMEGQEFLDWLKGKIRASLQEQGREVDDGRITLIAEINRDNFINEGALPAMKNLASEEVVRGRLMEIARQAPPADAAAPIAEAANLRRQKALQALEGNATAAELTALLDLALDETNPINVRDYAFDRVGDIGSRDAIPRLWPLVQTADNDALKKRLRWRAGELVLALGGPEIVPEFLAKLPSDRAVEYEPEELAGYAQRMNQMTPAPVAVAEAQLRSPSWHLRVIGIRFVERHGAEADVAKLQRLTSDSATGVGASWESREIPTVGKVAEDAIAKLRERLATPNAAAPAEAAPAGE
ncbi:MAG: hypothetical protein H6721_19715 [Sandaracinus sp.]|nr:hypothetical protein [Myxococcales bacterium]MCB9614224.1 hypothetical protein [Sandaracinus sp.]MCB9622547.1 hypothetical protein [Sandaracinus sp.]MCB9634358.1 hypothetical protein [Sandaracinus sp.]